MGGLFGGSTNSGSQTTRSSQFGQNLPAYITRQGMSSAINQQGGINDLIGMGPAGLAEQLGSPLEQQANYALGRSGPGVQSATQQYMNQISPYASLGFGAAAGNLAQSLMGPIGPSQAAQDASRMAAQEAARNSKIAGMASGQTMYQPGVDPNTGGTYQAGATPLAREAAGSIYRASMDPLMSDINRQYADRQQARGQGLNLASLMGNLAATGEKEAHNRLQAALPVAQGMQQFATPHNQMLSGLPQFMGLFGDLERHGSTFGANTQRGTQTTTSSVPNWALAAKGAQGLGQMAFAPISAPANSLAGMGFGALGMNRFLS